MEIKQQILAHPGVEVPINKLSIMIIKNNENEAILNNMPTKDKYLIGRFE